jgi:uncharacterized protein
VSARLAVRVQPRARRAGIGGMRADGRLLGSVAAPPEDGRANEAVAEVLGAALGVRARDVTVVRGHKAREKLIEVQGLTDAELGQRLERALREAGGEDGD